MTTIPAMIGIAKMTSRRQDLKDFYVHLIALYRRFFSLYKHTTWAIVGGVLGLVIAVNIGLSEQFAVGVFVVACIVAVAGGSAFMFGLSRAFSLNKEEEHQPDS